MKVEVVKVLVVVLVIVIMVLLVVVKDKEAVGNNIKYIFSN